MAEYGLKECLFPIALIFRPLFNCSSSKPLSIMRLFCVCFIYFCLSQPAYSRGLDAETDACFVRAGRYHGIDPSWLKAIAHVESKFNPKIISKRNKNGTFDVGMMQINSGWFGTLKRFGIMPGHLMNACTNIYVGAWILSANVRMYCKSWQAIGAYNPGSPTKLRQRSADYASKVRVAWESLSKPSAGRMAAINQEGVRYE